MIRKLTKKQIDILEDLIITNKAIYSGYEHIEEEHNEFSATYLIFPWLRKEKSLFNSLDINSEMLEDIEEWIEEKIGFVPDNTLLLSTLDSLDSKTYPYYRLLARLRYLSIDTKKGPNRFDPLFNDAEVMLLYNGLKKANEIYPEMMSELRHQSFMTLLDSPEAEIKVVLNGFKPIEQINDYVDLTSELSVLETLLSNYDKVKKADKLDFEKSSDALRIRDKRFFERFPYLVSRLNDMVSSATCTYDLTDSMEFIVTLEYLKAIIAFMSKDKRESIYKFLINNNCFSADCECYDFFMNLLDDAFDDIEDETKHVYYYTMCPRGGKNGKKR